MPADRSLGDRVIPHRVKRARGVLAAGKNIQDAIISAAASDGRAEAAGRGAAVAGGAAGEGGVEAAGVVLGLGEVEGAGAGLVLECVAAAGDEVGAVAGDGDDVVGAPDPGEVSR
ncbi:MAG: hypothetical protein R3B06_14665 [Kofleriaceae bacterium]